MRQKIFWTIGLVLALLLAVALGVQPVPVAHAATITVNTTDDELNNDGDCSLREAIQAANTDTAVSGCAAGNGADTITLPAGFYTLTIAGAGENANATGDLDITDDLTINGDGEGITIIQAGTNSTNGIDRVLNVYAAGAIVEINDVTIRYGSLADIQCGGGIRNDGTLTLNNTRVSSNTAPAAAGGGGICNVGTLTLNNSTVGYNDAAAGGGIDNFGTLRLNNSTVNDNNAITAGGITNNGTLTLDNCTVSGNDADGYGGGIANWNGTLTLNNSTIADNTADDDNNGFGDGGGVYVSGGTANVMNTIIADNQDRGGEAHDCSGILTSQGYNLFEWGIGCSIIGDTTGNINGADPDLGLLAANGGATRTHALQTGSPAIERIPNGTNGCQAGVSTDQRGYVRAGGAGNGGSSCDTGAYEYDTVPLAPPVGPVYLPIILRNY
jgi:CSLREA domain-containing protein